MVIGYIYKITNLFNGDMYIGQTYQPVEVRWMRHVNDAKSGDSRYLYCAMRKYGIENFKIEIIHICYSDCIKNLIDVLDRMEIFYINKYDTYNNGYNLTFGGRGVHGYKKSKETILKTTKKRFKMVCQYNLNGEFIRIYDSIKETSNDGFNTSAVSAVCLGNKPQHKGFYWQYYDGNNDCNINVCKKYHNEPHHIVQYDLNGNYIASWNSTREIEKQLGIDSSSISKVCRGERKSAGKFIWKMFNEDNILIA